ncbi:hypothetical protein GCM10023093_04090 [Nemorincola caseinilytica]|uniref:Signal transduction histidine kinase internal region domain-containing protein n=1 Tax=Nemorincola caseinilytica TaxID=2054315 RepID=A0ABP8N6N8_9BACT
MLCIGTHAQDISSFNLNSRNGLPSDHIYSMTVDRSGYLWICTDRGVVKYNGYECKQFSMATGLPSEDVWGLTEDLTGKLWLSFSSDEIGFIYNDKYTKAITPGMKGPIFPHHVSRYDSGIIFCNPFYNDKRHETIFMNRNDTMYSYPITHIPFRKPKDSFPPIPTISINFDKKIYVMLWDSIYALEGMENILKGHPEKITARTIHLKPVRMLEMAGKYLMFPMKGHLVNHSTGGISDDLELYSIGKGTFSKVSLSKLGIDEPIEYAGYNNSRPDHQNTLQVYTRHHVAKFEITDTGITGSSVFDIRRLTSKRVDKDRVTAYSEGTIWDTCLSTNASGVFMLGSASRYKPLPLELDGFKVAGTINDKDAVWWNGATRILLIIRDGRIMHRHYIPVTTQITDILSVNKDTILLAGSENLYLYGKDMISAPQGDYYYLKNIKAIERGKDSTTLCITRVGAYDPDLQKGKEGWQKVFIDVDRYDNIVYDNMRNLMWAYNHKKILLYNRKTTSFLYNTDIPGLKGKIEKICIDARHGNVFIKSMDMILNYDPGTRRSARIFPNLNTRKVGIDICKNTLVVYGEFGVMFALITGKGTLSEPIIYHNTKKTFYKKHWDHSITAGKMILQTDNGPFQITIPDEGEFAHVEKGAYAPRHKLLMTYGNTTRHLRHNDTLGMTQNDRTLHLDIVNPMGNGNVTYWYKLPDDSLWRSTAEGEMTMPDRYTPDNYYELCMYYADDAWKGNVVKMHVYIVPHWWQTKTMRTMIWVSVILLAISVIVLSIVITRRMVLRATQKKQLQMEMELKAIYAQINPHFIFNTLTSALLLVSKNKMDEAYTHISKFSKLLRSYLRSSRNKYILLTDEIDNLRNYTELQQTRFKDRFACDIIVDAELEHTNMKIPSLLIQPFVENAINHGMLHSAVIGHLTIEFRNVAEKNMIQCIVTDNGIGREQARENKMNSTTTLDSYGNLLIKDLVSIFNKYEDMKIEIAYEDKRPPETGTAVIISITNPPRE